MIDLTMDVLMKTVGVAGLLCITAGILLRSRCRQDWFYISGGVLLGAYSVYIQDALFVTLQVIFTMAAMYDVWKHRKTCMK